MSLNQLISPSSLSQTISCRGLKVENNNISGYIPSTLTVYEEFDTTATSTGCIEFPINFSFMRIGRHVTLSFEGFNTSPQTCSNNGTMDFNGLIPARFRPEGFDSCVIRVNQNGTDQAGLAQVDGTTGNLRIFPAVSGGTWASAQLISIQGFSCSYTVV